MKRAQPEILWEENVQRTPWMRRAVKRKKRSNDYERMEMETMDIDRDTEMNVNDMWEIPGRK